MGDSRVKHEKVNNAELRKRLVSRRGRDLMEIIIDHMKHSQTKVWLELGEGRIFLVKDKIRGFILHMSYCEKIFTFRDHRNQTQDIHEDEIKNVNGF